MVVNKFYPNAPGAKGLQTSFDAADTITARAGTLRGICDTAIKKAWPAGYTADEVAERLGLDVLSIRPRIAELHKLGKIVPLSVNGSRVKRENKRSGLMAQVFCYFIDPKAELENTLFRDPNITSLGTILKRIEGHMAIVSKSNMRIWNEVDKTNPEDTKKSDFGRGFTAIDAYTQIKRATELFGPVGEGWGWEITHLIRDTETTIVALRMWHREPVAEGAVPEIFSFSVCGQCNSQFSNKPDADAVKKALTDGVTKGLSYLGFNADIFLGKFDDNKYVEERKAEVASGTAEQFAKDDQIWLSSLASVLEAAENGTVVEEIAKAEKEQFSKIIKRNPKIGQEAKAMIDEARLRF